MKKILLLFLFYPAIAYSCNGYVIGFKGLDDIFDQQAFKEYADRRGYCSVSYSRHSVNLAIQHISTLSVPYRLYGYSAGSISVRSVLENKNIKKPEFVITVGAYKTTDVNFDKFKVPYVNYFDHSGRGQKSPGIYLDVSHNKIQQTVNVIEKLDKK